MTLTTGELGAAPRDRSQAAAGGCSVDAGEEYAEIVSLYDVLDEQAVSADYEGLDETTRTAADTGLQTVEQYDRLAAEKTAESHGATEHVEMKEFDADDNPRVAVSQPLSHTLFVNYMLLKTMLADNC